MTTPRIEEMVENCLPKSSDLQKVGDHYWGGDYEPTYCELINLEASFREILKPKLRQALTEAHQAGVDEAVDENTSDGYHTFKELYDFRLLYNAHLFNEWAKQGMYNVHKSQRHSDGELCFGRDDYFIVVATLPTGQISNHYPMTDWGLFQCEAVEKAKHHWDGHTSQDVANRLRQALDNTVKALQNNK